MIGKILKWGGAALLAWIGMTNAWPAISEAWKARQAAVVVSSASSGLSMAEVTSRYHAALQAKGVKSITKADIDAIKNGDRWIVGANYEVVKKLYGTMSLTYDFSISADRKSLWQND